MEEKCPYVREKMGTNFLYSPNSMNFTAFSHVRGNWWRNPCISHFIKYTKEYESNWKKHPYYGKSMSTNFSGSPHMMGFAGFSRKSIFQAFPIQWVFLLFPHTFGNWQENPCISLMMKYATGWQSNGKKHLLYGKSMGTNFSDIPDSMGFSILWGIRWENPFISHVMKCTIRWESNGKKHPYCGKIMRTNFPGSPHTMGFLGYYWEPIFQTFPHSMGLTAFSNVMGNEWENTCISHVRKYNIKWESNDNIG